MPDRPHPLSRWWRSPVMACVRLAPQVAPLQSALLVQLLAADALLTAGVVLATGAIVREVAWAAGAGASGAHAQAAPGWLILWGALVAASQVTPRLVAGLASAISGRVENEIKERAMIALNRPWGVRHLEDPATAQLVSQISGLGLGAYGPGAALHALITNRLSSSLRALAAGSLLIAYHWWAVAVLIVAHTSSAAVARRNHLRQARTLVGMTDGVRRANYLRNLALGADAAKEVRVFGLGDWLAGRLEDAWKAGLAEQRGSQDRGLRDAVAAAIAVVGLTFLIYSALARDAADGAITAAALVVYLNAAEGLGGLAGLNSSDYAVEYGAVSASAVGQLEAIAVSEAPPASARAVPPEAPQQQIAFEAVSFTYPHTVRPVLKGLDLVLPAGASTAIVGLNGAGKSTLVKLLGRLYDPTDGAVRVDGVDLRDLDPAVWRRQIAAVFQHFLRFDLSARENIGLGRSDRTWDDAALDRAARRAGALDRILALPAGWDTPLSRQYGGVDLSGGEWQRIALARAFFAVEGGAQVLVLDEPTAALDPRAEAAFHDRFLENTRGLTTVVISHRFATLRRADQICVLEDGFVAELGSHEQLMRRGGRYAALFTRQSARFVTAGAA